MYQIVTMKLSSAPTHSGTAPVRSKKLNGGPLSLRSLAPYGLFLLLAGGFKGYVELDKRSKSTRFYEAVTQECNHQELERINAARSKIAETQAETRRFFKRLGAQVSEGERQFVLDRDFSKGVATYCADQTELRRLQVQNDPTGLGLEKGYQFPWVGAIEEPLISVFGDWQTSETLKAEDLCELSGVIAHEEIHAVGIPHRVNLISPAVLTDLPYMYGIAVQAACIDSFMQQTNPLPTDEARIERAEKMIIEAETLK